MAHYFVCPFCNAETPVINETVHFYQLGFRCNRTFFSTDSLRGDFYSTGGGSYKNDPEVINVLFSKCARCEKINIAVIGEGEILRGQKIPIYPKFNCKSYPNYIPQSIRDDYTEACEILHISPKAAATLARRCMQGIIRDFWQVNDKTLHKEIDLIKNLVAPDVWQSLDNLRQIGNIGAHMEQDINLIIDIDPDEAQTLISFIELLLKEWYIAKHEREEMLNSIPAINAQKQALRNSPQTP